MAVVRIKSGLIRGTEENGNYAFRGIPYAKPPVGELRWKHPQSVEPWEGVRDATQFGSPCCQAPSQVVPGGDPEERGVVTGIGTEDCLYINVFTPSLEQKKMPVMFWIHGGAHCCGSGGGKNAIYEPFTKRGIVYVSFNYRIGLMGYFAHPELSAENEHHVSGNYAHYDQLFALKWVKENIEAFGGDPDNITVGGCSAGAGGTQVLANSPLAAGLFQHAIIQSSLGLDAASYPEDDKLSNMEDMEARGVEFMKINGCKNIQELRAMPYEKLIDFPEASFRRKYHYGTVIGTSKDGYLIPEHHKDSQQKVKNMNIPYIIGCTHDEGGEHILRLGKDVFLEQSKAVFGDKIEQYIEAGEIKDDASAVLAARRTHLKLAGTKVFAEMSAKAGKQPVYVYDFVRNDPVAGIAKHGTCTQYLSDNYKKLPNTGPDDEKTAYVMQEYWCNFIKTGNPNGSGLPEWTPYSAENRKVLYLDANPAVCDDAEREDSLMRFTREFLEEKLMR